MDMLQTYLMSERTRIDAVALIFQPVLLHRPRLAGLRARSRRPHYCI